MSDQRRAETARETEAERRLVVHTGAGQGADYRPWNERRKNGYWLDCQRRTDWVG